MVAVDPATELAMWNLQLAVPPSHRVEVPPVHEDFNCGGGVCFIATAAYGTPMAEEIQILRQFRDEYLLTNPLGQALVDLYYRVSPPIAEFITEHPSLKPIVRAGLVPAVAMSTVAVNTTPAEKAAIVGLLGAGFSGSWLSGQRGGEAKVQNAPGGRNRPIFIRLFSRLRPRGFCLP